ncbi:MAG: insulinase family protein [Ignavibacteria bacterium]|nr:insulinase family protein [Ignavibacteria bacterium]
MKPLLTVFLLLSLLGTIVMAQVDRTKQPKPGPTPAFALPKPQHATLKNGLKVMLVEQHELPVVNLQLVFQSGSANDPFDMPGLASVMFDMIDEGTVNRDALQIAEDIAFLGASMNWSTWIDGSYGTLQTLKEKLSDALAIYADVLLNPSFPAKEFDRIQKTRIAALMQENDQPAVVATKVFSHVVFGGQHPYGTPSNGTMQSIRSLTIDNLKKFYADHVRSNNATLIAAGDITLKELIPLLEKHLGSWKSGNVPMARFPKTAPELKRGVFLVDKPQAPQSQLRVGHLGTHRLNEDYFALEVMNTILGGQFTSRINYNLRERRGYTYGARSGFSYRKSDGPFLASAGVKSSVTDSSVIETLYEIKRIRDEAVTVEELEMAKTSMILRYPSGFEAPAQLTNQLANVVLYGLGDNYFNTYISNINKVTLADVQRVAKKYLNPEQISIVIVGDVASIREPLEKLGYGNAMILSSDGEPVK